MIVFWGIAAGMVVLAILLLSLPWLRTGKDRAVAREAVNVAVYRDRLQDLETELHEQRLTQEQYAQEKRELEQSLLEDVASTPQAQPTARGAGRWVLGLVAVSVPVLAIALYTVLGGGDAALTPPRPAAQAAGAAGGMQMPPGMPSVEQMVETLAERLKNKPDDATGWTMLGRSYVVLQRYQEGAKAYGKAYALKSDDPQLMVDYAESLALANNNQLSGESRTLVHKALEMNKENPKALWLAGMAAFQDQQYQAATDYWQRLAPLVPEGSNIAKVVASSIDEAQRREQAGKGSIQPAAESAPQGPSPPAEASPP